MHTLDVPEAQIPEDLSGNVEDNNKAKGETLDEEINVKVLGHVPLQRNS